MLTPPAARILSRLSVVTVLLAGGSLGAGGCVERLLSVESDPPGALVYLNDREVGRTPMARPFTWYGTYDVTLRQEGYETLKTTGPVIAPWWQWMPFDLVAEILPFRLTDRQHLTFKMKPTSPEKDDPQRMIARGEELRGKLLSGEKTTTRPTTAPSTKPKGERPLTQPG